MKKLSIGLKITLSFAVILLMVLAIGILSHKNLTRLQNESYWVTHTYDVKHSIETVLDNLINAETGQRGYLLTGMDKYLEPYNIAISKLEKDINELKALTLDNPNQQNKIEALKVLTSKKLDELNTTVILRKNEGFEAAKQVVTTDLGRSIMGEIRALLTEMIYEEEQLHHLHIRTSNQATLHAKNMIIWITIIAFIIVILLSFALTLMIARPIKTLSKIAHRISLGDLSMEINVNRDDEIGKLSETFKIMQQSMQEKASQAKEIANGNLKMDINPLSNKDSMGTAFKVMVDRLRNQIHEITKGVNVLLHSSSEIMASASQLASSAAETASSVSQTTTTVEEVKQTAEMSNYKAKQVSENAIKTAEISKEGMRAISNTAEGMQRVKLQMESIAEMVIELSEQSQAVGEITSTVRDIAEQSNLLAVNAAIESMKAGEQGKGFSVVAQEIKNLATRSKEATTQVDRILKDIQKSINAAVLATEEGGKVVEDGLKLTEISGETIETLTSNVDEAANVMIQISASSQQQLEGMGQMVAAMENIKESSLQAAASTQQSVDSANDLKTLGFKLKELMNQYEVLQ